MSHMANCSQLATAPLHNVIVSGFNCHIRSCRHQRLPCCTFGIHLSDYIPSHRQGLSMNCMKHLLCITFFSLSQTSMVACCVFRMKNVNVLLVIILFERDFHVDDTILVLLKGKLTGQLFPSLRRLWTAVEVPSVIYRWESEDSFLQVVNVL